MQSQDTTYKIWEAKDNIYTTQMIAGSVPSENL